MKLRTATPSDQDAIHAVHWTAFPEEERKRVADLAVDLLDTGRNPGTTSWVAELDGKIVGHVAFSPAVSEADPDFKGSILAPVAVHPDFHKRGIARALIERGIEHEKQAGVDAILVYGDPAFYGRFGFSAEAARNLSAPMPLQFPFGWQAMDSRSEKRPVNDLTCVPSLMRKELW